jgi:hypothetical protein
VTTRDILSGAGLLAASRRFQYRHGQPDLPKQVVADLVKHHVITLKSVVDAQAAKDQAGAYTAMRAAAGHMQMIADPLAVAIVKQFPDRYTASAK